MMPVRSRAAGLGCVVGVADQAGGMRLEQPARYLVLTQTSTYVIDTGAMRAHRTPGGAASQQQPASGQGPVHRRLFTDGSPLVLISLPEIEVGQPMRLRIKVADQFLDRPDDGSGTPMVTTPVLEVSRMD